MSSRADSIQLIEGKSMSFNANVRGYPYPMMRVSHMGRTLSTAVSASSSPIYFTNANRTDAGIYTLTLYTFEGIATITINLAVICKFITIL